MAFAPPSLAAIATATTPSRHGDDSDDDAGDDVIALPVPSPNPHARAGGFAGDNDDSDFGDSPRRAPVIQPPTETARRPSSPTQPRPPVVVVAVSSGGGLRVGPAPAAWSVRDREAQHRHVLSLAAGTNGGGGASGSRPASPMMNAPPPVSPPSALAASPAPSQASASSQPLGGGNASAVSNGTLQTQPPLHLRDLGAFQRPRGGAASPLAPGNSGGSTLLLSTSVLPLKRPRDPSDNLTPTTTPGSTLTASTAQSTSEAAGSAAGSAAGGGGAAFHRVHSQLKVELPSLQPVRFFGAARCAEDVYRFDPSADRIGEGTYGAVYRGVRRSDGRRVALKRLKPLAQLEGFPLTSVRELVVLNHLGTALRDDEKAPFCLLRDCLVGRDWVDTYLVFDFVDHSLAGLLSRSDAFLSDEAITVIFRQLLGGLAALHRHEIIHRDIKANNVLLTTDGFVKICDFGLALGTDSRRSRMTPSLIALQYRPPEMLLGMALYSDKVDVWSLGCLLAQVYLGQPPFYNRGAHAAGTEVAHLQEIVRAIGGQLSSETRARCAQQLLTGLPSAAAPITVAAWIRARADALARSGRPVRDVPTAVVAVLARALVFDPAARATVAELRAMPLFTAGGDAAADQAQRNLARLLERLTPSHEPLPQQQQRTQPQQQRPH